MFAAHLSWKLKKAFLIVCRPVCPSVNLSHFQLLLQNYWTNFNQTWHRASFFGGDSSLFKWRTTPFFRGDKSEIISFYSKKIKIFFSRTPWTIWTKLGTKHPWVHGIQVCSNEGPRLFPRGDNGENVKLYWKYLKISFSRTIRPISTKHGEKSSLGRGNSSLFKWRAIPFYNGDNSEIIKLY